MMTTKIKVKVFLLPVLLFLLAAIWRLNVIQNSKNWYVFVSFYLLLSGIACAIVGVQLYNRFADKKGKKDFSALAYYSGLAYAFLGPLICLIAGLVYYFVSNFKGAV